MKVNFEQLKNEFKTSEDSLSLIEELRKISRINSGELADDQVIISSKHSKDVIYDVFSAIYGKMPRKIITASKNNQIISFV